MEARDVVDVSYDSTRRLNLQPIGLGNELGSLRAVARDKQERARKALPNHREGVEKQIKALLRFQTTDASYCQRLRRDVQFLPVYGNALLIAKKGPMVDAVQHDGHALWIGSVSQQLGSDLGGDGNHPR